MFATRQYMHTYMGYNYAALNAARRENTAMGWEQKQIMIRMVLPNADLVLVFSEFSFSFTQNQ